MTSKRDVMAIGMIMWIVTKAVFQMLGASFIDAWNAACLWTIMFFVAMGYMSRDDSNE